MADPVNHNGFEILDPPVPVNAVGAAVACKGDFGTGGHHAEKVR